MQQNLEALDRSLRKWNLRMNVNKTKVMELSRTGGRCEVRVQGKQVEQVKAMKYLGVMMSDDGSMDEEVEHRIGTATRMIGAMSTKVLQKSELSRKTKMKVYNACIVPTLLYGCEAYVPVASHGDEVFKTGGRGNMDGTGAK